jgi:hypothetical protein
MAFSENPWRKQKDPWILLPWLINHGITMALPLPWNFPKSMDSP